MAIRNEHNRMKMKDSTYNILIIDGKLSLGEERKNFQGNLCLFLTIKSKNYKLRAFLPCRGNLSRYRFPCYRSLFISHLSRSLSASEAPFVLYWIYPRKRNTRQAVVYRRRWNVSKTHQIVKFQRVPEEGGFKIETVALLSVKALYGPTCVDSKQNIFFSSQPLRFPPRRTYN